MNRLRVLTFHRIADPGDVAPYDPKLVSAGVKAFEQQISWLAKNYQIVNADQVLAACDGAARLPKNAVLLTFDDAYPDFRDVAWPILHNFGLPVLLFVPTNYPGNPQQLFWWDALHAALLRTHCKSINVKSIGTLPLDSVANRIAAAAILRAHVKALQHYEAMQWLGGIHEVLNAYPTDLESTLTWEELRSLRKQGVTIAAHSRSHAQLDKLPRDQVADEIAGSVEDIRREIGAVPPIFCYPAGGYDRHVLEVAAQSDIRVAFTTDTGFNDLDSCQSLALRRINMTPRTTPPVLKARLTILGDRLDRIRRKWRRQQTPRPSSATTAIDSVGA